MNFNLPESSNEELIEIVNNAHMYSDETVQLAVAILNERNYEVEKENESKKVFGRNKSYKSFTYFQLVAFLGIFVRMGLRGISIIDVLALILTIIWFIYSLSEYRSNYIELNSQGIKINKGFNVHSFLWSDIRMICKKENQYIGLIFHDDKAFKFTLSGVDRREIDLLFDEIQKTSGMNIEELYPKS